MTGIKATEEYFGKASLHLEVSQKTCQDQCVIVAFGLKA